MLNTFKINSYSLTLNHDNKKNKNQLKKKCHKAKRKRICNMKFIYSVSLKIYYTSRGNC